MIYMTSMVLADAYIYDSVVADAWYIWLVLPMHIYMTSLADAYIYDINGCRCIYIYDSVVAVMHDIYDISLADAIYIWLVLPMHDIYD